MTNEQLPVEETTPDKVAETESQNVASVFAVSTWLVTDHAYLSGTDPYVPKALQAQFDKEKAKGGKYAKRSELLKHPTFKCDLDKLGISTTAGGALVPKSKRDWRAAFAGKLSQALVDRMHSNSNVYPIPVLVKILANDASGLKEEGLYDLVKMANIKSDYLFTVSQFRTIIAALQKNPTHPSSLEVCDVHVPIVIEVHVERHRGRSSQLMVIKRINAMTDLSTMINALGGILCEYPETTDICVKAISGDITWAQRCVNEALAHWAEHKTLECFTYELFAVTTGTKPTIKYGDIVGIKSIAQLTGEFKEAVTLE